MPPELERMYEHMRGMEEKASQRHVEIIERLAKLESRQHIPPCADIVHVKNVVEDHIENHKWVRRTWAGEVARLVIAAVSGAAVAIGGMLIKKGP